MRLKTNTQGMPPDVTSQAQAAPSPYIPVPEFYAGKGVLVTGGTGFLGKVLVEKLLRSCPGVKVIYLLIRPKRGADPAERLQNIIKSPLFEVLREQSPSAFGKVVPVLGDIGEPGLGLSPEDEDLLLREVSIVFHSAATVKFDEPIRVAVKINLEGTKRLVELCHRMTGLQALVYVSTCYCNCDRQQVDEVVYPVPYDPDSVAQTVNWMDDQLADQITPTLLGKRPNTYTFTKALAENIFVQKGAGLPITIVRPTIMASTWKEPMPGWIEGLNGTTGVIAAYGKGIMWTMICDGQKVGDMIPADMVINLIICAAWRTATVRSDQVVVYNCCSGARKPLTWDQMFVPIQKTVRSHPSEQVLWYPGDNPFCTSRPVHRVKEALLHYLPALLFDTVLRLLNMKPGMVRVQKRLSRGFESVAYFTTHQWRFTDDNTLGLSKCLSDDDRQSFFFDIADIDWPSYMEEYVKGVRRYIHGEQPDSLARSSTLLRRLLWLQRVFKLLILALLLRLRVFRALFFFLVSKLLQISRTIPFLFK